MCVIALIPQNIEVPVEWLENGAGNNPDGHGWAVASEEHGLVVGKSMDPKVAIKEFTEEVERQGVVSVKLWHSRIGTHGTENLDNVHPFFVPDVNDEGHDQTTVMAHNGIMPGLWIPDVNDPRSDTRYFVDVTAKWHLQRETGIPSRRRGRVIQHMIGGYNKLVFLSVRAPGRPRVRIINSRAGTWDKGVWFSNTSYKRKPIKRGYSYAYVGGANTGKECTAEGCKTTVYGHMYVMCYACRTEADRTGRTTGPLDTNRPWENGWRWIPGYTQVEDGKWVHGRWVRASEEDDDSGRQRWVAGRGWVNVETETTVTLSDEIDEESRGLLDDIDRVLGVDATITDIDHARVCEVCETKGSVHGKTNVCLNCKWCLDCWSELDLCECFDWSLWTATRDTDAANRSTALQSQFEEEARDAARRAYNQAESDKATELWLASRAEEVAEEVAVTLEEHEARSVPVVEGRSPEELARDREVARFFGMEFKEDEVPAFGVNVHTAVEVTKGKGVIGEDGKVSTVETEEPHPLSPPDTHPRTPTSQYQGR